MGLGCLGGVFGIFCGFGIVGGGGVVFIPSRLTGAFFFLVSAKGGRGRAWLREKVSVRGLAGALKKKSVNRCGMSVCIDKDGSNKQVTQRSEVCRTCHAAV